MIVFVVLGVILVIAAYGADRLIKARTQNRRLRRMNERLTAATVKTERQQAQRQASDAAGAEMTSVMPAIKNPAVRPAMNNPAVRPAMNNPAVRPAMKNPAVMPAIKDPALTAAAETTGETRLS
jgi:hypothetical protein